MWIDVKILVTASVEKIEQILSNSHISKSQIQIAFQIIVIVILPLRPEIIKKPLVFYGKQELIFLNLLNIKSAFVDGPYHQ